MAKKIFLTKEQFRMLQESTGDITLQAYSSQPNAAAYQQVFNKPENQKKIQQADSMGGNVNFHISNNNGSNDNDLTIAVDGKDGLNNMNDATKQAVSNGADIVVNSANKVSEGVKLSKKQIVEMRLRNMEKEGTKLTKKELLRKL